MLLVARRQPVTLFEPVDASFHHVAPGVGRPVEDQRMPWARGVTRLLIGTLGNGGRDGALPQQPTPARVAVTLVGDEAVWPRVGLSPSAGSWYPDSVKHGGQLGAGAEPGAAGLGLLQALGLPQVPGHQCDTDFVSVVVLLPPPRESGTRDALAPLPL